MVLRHWLGRRDRWLPQMQSQVRRNTTGTVFFPSKIKGRLNRALKSVQLNPDILVLSIV